MPAVEVRLLGPLEVGVSGRRLELRRQKQRALLALLALRAGEVVSTDRLVEELWGGEPPKAAVGSLQNLVSELRKALTPRLILTRAPGYVLALDRDCVDAHRFERLVRAAQESERAEVRAARLREALALWRGPPLADLAFESFAQVEIARLEELRAATREELFAAELERGQHGRLVAGLEAFVAEHPLRERPRGQLMLALYRAGRQADALEAYRSARDTLVDELGIDPSPELQQLEQAILRHDPALDLERRAPAPQALPERRKPVTILFADLVDSSALAAQLDPEVLRNVMRAYFDVVKTVVERHGGTVEKFIGDAAMAVFGIPEVHEDDALRAVRAALELHDATAALETDLGVALRLYIGVNTGEVLATDPSSGESFATGAAVILATRLQQAAVPGETLVGETTHRLVRDLVELDVAGEVDLGGALGRVSAFRVVGWTEQAAGLSLVVGAQLVGRTAELARLRAALAGVRSERRSRVLTLLGEAGIGKTRLTRELVASADATVLVGRCVPYGVGATYLPLAEIVRQAVPTRVRASVASLLEGDEQADVVAQRIAELAGEAEGAVSTGELFWAVRRFLEALALERPVLVVLDDVHWAEQTLLDLIEYLAAWTSDVPILVLCLARPDLLETRPGWAESSLRLEPLSADESAQLVEELADVDANLRARLVDIAGGNALFLEQLLAYVLEDDGPGTLESLPPSIEGLLASRLDRLEHEERALVERAAVVGKDFPRAAVIHLSPPGELSGIDGRLTTLARKGLIRARRLGEDLFGFHHVLVRDAAYAGITKQRRGELHERHATWLAQRDGPAELVGYHLEQAYDYRRELKPSDPALPELARRAGEHLATAGIRAFKRADTPATVNLLGRAAGLLEDDDASKAEVLCELGLAQRWLGDAVAGEASLQQAIGVAATARNRSRELRSRIELGHLKLFTDRDADPAALVALVQEATPLFEQLDDDRALGRAWRHVGYVRGAMEGQCAEWQTAAERALQHYRRSGWSTSACLSELSAALFYGPTPISEGIERCEALLDDAGDRAGTAHVLVYLGGLQALAERYDDALVSVGRAEEIYRDLGLDYALADNGERIGGGIHRLNGDLENAERAFRFCCETFERVRDEAGLSSAAAELGQVLFEQERHAEAAHWADVAEQHAPTGDLTAQFSWRALRAKLLAVEGLQERAGSLAQEALRIVESTDALTHHGDVLFDLALVRLYGGRRAEASTRIEEALGLYARKGNTASAHRAHLLQAELAVA
jgi:DNA-binding SARP family transcriptional activator